MKSYLQFEEQQKFLLRSRLIQQMGKLQINSFHDLYQKQNLIAAEKLNPNEVSTWIEISRNALYNLQKPDANPELDTLIKLCFLLELDCQNLFEKENVKNE
ncbi:hypothetical protein ACQKDB_12315 [Planococcus kocurii]|uniref:hypothetical protein n=1 Tax=Planococcus kocurii TaxID=1374 RepID=UPI003CFC0B55